MPIHEYRCPECGHREEHLVNNSSREVFFCPICKKPSFDRTMVKIISASNFQLKGGGWAKDGYSKR